MARLPEPLTPPHNSLNASPQPCADADSMTSSSESDALHLRHTVSRKKQSDINRLDLIPLEPKGWSRHSVQGSSFDNNMTSEHLANQTRKCISTGISRDRQKFHGVKSKLASRSKSRSLEGHKSRSLSLRKTPSNTEDYTDEYDNATLDNDLRCIIKANKALYERILRYEPIHFNIFLNILAIQAMDIQSIRSKLKYFLDNHAIHFHGYLDPPGNQRRY